MQIYLSQLRPQLKVSISLFLLAMGYAYLFAQINLQVNTRQADGDASGLATVQDIVVTYHGDRSQTLLGQKINGSMREYLPYEEDKIAIEQWITNGRTEEEYVDIVQPIMEDNCVTCHYDGGHDYTLETYDEVFTSAEPNAGPSIGKLARFTHYHAFGMGIYAFLLSTIFALTTFPPFFRIFGVALPFLAIFLDITSWWLTRLVSPAFAYTVYLGGVATGISFAITIFGSLYDMWLRPVEK